MGDLLCVMLSNGEGGRAFSPLKKRNTNYGFRIGMKIKYQVEKTQEDAQNT